MAWSNCPCGKWHRVTPWLVEVIRDHGSQVPVPDPSGRWWVVPRVWIAAHGDEDIHVPAELFGWSRAEGIEGRQDSE